MVDVNEKLRAHGWPFGENDVFVAYFRPISPSHCRSPVSGQFRFLLSLFRLKNQESVTLIADRVCAQQNTSGRPDTHRGEHHTVSDQKERPTCLLTCRFCVCLERTNASEWPSLGRTFEIKRRRTCTLLNVFLATLCSSTRRFLSNIQRLDVKKKRFFWKRFESTEKFVWKQSWTTKNTMKTVCAIAPTGPSLSSLIDLECAWHAIDWDYDTAKKVAVKRSGSVKTDWKMIYGNMCRGLQFLFLKNGCFFHIKQKFAVSSVQTSYKRIVNLSKSANLPEIHYEFCLKKGRAALRSGLGQLKNILLKHSLSRTNNAHEGEFLMEMGIFMQRKLFRSYNKVWKTFIERFWHTDMFVYSKRKKGRTDG